MSMTQRYAGMLRRHAGEWDKQAMPVQAECARQSARHMEELQAKVDAVHSPWKPMKTATDRLVEHPDAAEHAHMTPNVKVSGVPAFWLVRVDPFVGRDNFGD